MKRIKLLFAALAAMVSLGVQAQLTDGTVYWIQDAGTGQFISQGDAYSTKAVTQDVGGLGFEAVYVSDGVYKLKNIMWNTVNNVTDKGLGANQYVDQDAVNYTITASGDGYLVSYNGYYLVNNSSENAYKEKPLGTTTDASAASVWKFLTKSEYDAAIQAYKDAKAASYATALGYSGIASVSALEALISDANQFISKNYTSSITNPTMGSNLDGWANGFLGGRSANGQPGVGSGCAEYWNSCGYATQTVSNLPNGLYKVTFVGTYRPKDLDNANKLASEKASSPAFVYANDAKIEFLHWIDVPAKANGRGGITTANGYGHAFYTYVTDGTLALGVVADGYTGGYSWNPFGQFTLTYYTDQVEDADITALVAQIPAESTIPAAVYSNLTSLKNTLESTKTIADFNALSEAVTAANALVAPYAALVAEVAKAKALGIETADADAYLVGVTTAAEATANTQALMVAEYNYVVANYTTAIDLGTWTTENAGTMTSQHWDGTGQGGTPYNEQLNGWNQATNWSTSYTQTITLPAGEYVFKVAGRHSQYSVLTLSVKEGEAVIGTVNDFPTGDTGRGINKNGVTSFDPADAAGFANGGAGRGWQWRYVPFTLTAETAVTISVVGNNPDAVQYQWLSFCNYTVQAKPSVAAARIAYEQAVANANTALANSTYANVGGTDRSNLEAAVAVTPTETIEWYDEHKAIVEGYTTAFTAGVGSWNSYVAKAPVAKAEADLISTTICEGLTTPNTAAEAAAAPGHIRELTAAYVSTNYTYPLTTVIGDFTSWTRTATYIDGDGEHEDEPQTNKTQHWSGAESVYFEQGTHGWGASNGFNCTYTKTATLPAGNYVVKVAARASGDVTGTLRTTATSNTVAMPNFGAASKGIDTSGAANFGDGEFANGGVGFGWEWRFLPFTLGENGEVTITIEESTTVQYNWFSLADAVLLSDESKFIPATAEDYAALNAAIAAHTLGFEAGEYAPYNNVAAVAAVAAGQAIDQTAENAQEAVQAATAAITGVTWTANETEVNAIYNGDFAIAAHDGASNAQPTGWYRNDGIYTGDGYNVRYVNIPEGVAGNTSNHGLFGKFTMKYGAETGYSLPLKEGYYKLTFSYGGWNEIGTREVKLYNDDNDATVEVSTVTAADNQAHQKASSWRAYSSLITVPAAGDYTLSFYRQNTSSQNQIVLTDIVLVKATAADFKDALLAEITAANGVDVTTNVGEGVFQIPAAAATALTTAISDAQGVYDNADATIDQVLTATESVKTAVETYNNVELNAPDAEKIYALTIVDEGKAWNGNAVTFIAGARSDQGGYGIKYLAPTNVNLAQGLKLEKTTGNKYKISVTKADGYQQYITTAKLGHNTGNNQQIRTTDDVENALEVEIRLNGDGQFLLWNTAQNAAIANNDNNDMYTSRTANFTIAETSKPSITINTTAAGWGTVMLPFAATLPGVTAYTCAGVKENGKTLEIVEVESSDPEVCVLEPNKPYIIEGNVKVDLTGDAQGTALEVKVGWLTGVYASQLAPVGSYVLQKHDDVVGFYQVVLDAEPTVAANRAYLTVPSEVKAAAFFFDEGQATAIQSVFNGVAAGEIYDLSGRKLNKLQKGVNIVNGKKVMVK